MLTYFYIALGGAIGSVARAWTTNVMVRIAGANFPWGTICINVAGSFIIGFFGALTASDGRFQVHADARAFVMIGICGGYTTFSSFSLQTLDLLRDGKPGAAFANIVLSVVLCLAAVSAGYAGAMAVNNGAMRAETYKAHKADYPKVVGKAALAVLDAPGTVGSVLSSAAALLRLYGGGRIEALAVRTPPFSELIVADQAWTPAEEESLRAGEVAWAAALKAAVERWEEEKPGAATADFIDVEGDIADVVAGRGRQADAVIVPAASLSRRSRDALHAAIFDTGRPVLVAPPLCAEAFGRVIAVAWKDDARAPKAVLSAMPILKKARAVHVLRAHAAARVPAILKEHGVAAEAHALDGPGPVGAELLQKAHELGAGLIVMGAYAHGEWREALLGGVTRYMLDHADLPLFMQH